jgi:hypothetical protein
MVRILYCNKNEDVGVAYLKYKVRTQEGEDMVFEDECHTNTSLTELESVNEKQLCGRRYH